MERRHLGVTLIELLIVLVIVGISCAMAVPGFSLLMRKVQAKSAAFQLRDAFQLARSDAMSRRRFVGVAIDTGTLAWNRFIDNPSGPRPGAFDSLDTVSSRQSLPGYQTTSRSCTRLDASVCSVVFSPDGSTVDASSLRLVLRNATANVSLNVLIIAATGLPLVEVQP